MWSKFDFKNLSIFVLSLSFIVLPSLAGAQDLSFETGKKVRSWNQARQECKNIGKVWDLPTPDQAFELLSNDQKNLYYFYRVTDQGKQTDYVYWVRSENEDYNVQLKNTSVAMRVGGQDQKISEFNLSRKDFAEMQETLGLLKSMPAAMIRTESEQEIFENAITRFRSIYPTARIGLDAYAHYDQESLILQQLPPRIFTPQVKAIMLKFHPESLSVMQKNIDLILNNFKAGLKVICVKN